MCFLFSLPFAKFNTSTICRLPIGIIPLPLPLPSHLRIPNLNHIALRSAASFSGSECACACSGANSSSTFPLLISSSLFSFFLAISSEEEEAWVSGSGVGWGHIPCFPDSSRWKILPPLSLRYVGHGIFRICERGSKMNEAKTETIKNGCRLAVGPMRRGKRFL